MSIYCPTHVSSSENPLRRFNLTHNHRCRETLLVVDCSSAVDQVGCIQVQECQSIPRAPQYANKIQACHNLPRHLLWPQACDQDRPISYSNLGYVPEFHVGSTSGSTYIGSQKLTASLLTGGNHRKC
eukprot:sb/3475475/